MVVALTTKNERKRRIGVIGGGLFGVLVALKLAKRGFSVEIFEKEDEILRGASYINQNRLHMGYHYPRSYETAELAKRYQKTFRELFKEAVANEFDHFYCIAKEGSRVSGEEYIDFCRKIGIPHEKKFPKRITVSADKVEFCIKVPEKMYDGGILKRSLRSMLDNEEGINVSLSTEVVNVVRSDRHFEVGYVKNGKNMMKRCDALVNATYSNINKIIKMLGCETRQYQFELCEIPIVRVPWKEKTGCAILDGPFFGVLPCGFSDEYMLYDVELSVLERCYGDVPRFRRSINYYNQRGVRSKRFKKYVKKAKEYIREMEQCAYRYSIYVTRVVLPEKEADDARPTEILDHGGGFWSIFSGKITMAIPTAEKIAEEMMRYFNETSAN